ncbi:MAG: DUF433 domain-containing protein [Bacteroidota bacterium]
MINWQDYITSNPEVMYGKPVVVGTRIPVDIIIEKLSLGETIDDLLEAYPTISREHIFSCLAYAVAMIRNEEAYAIAS